MNTPTYWLQLYKEHSRNRKLPAATQTACFNIVLFDRIKCTRLNTKELRSCLDYIMLRKEHANECRNCTVLPSEAITKQHIILIDDLVAKKTRQRRAAGRKRIRWWELKDEESKEKFRRNLVERLSNIDEATTENVEQ